MTGSTPKRHTATVCLVLMLGTLALYWPARHFDFVQYDDNDYVFENPTVKAGLTWWGFVWSFVDAHALNWHPVTWLSHMLDCQLFGLNAGPHHLVNVLLHCANAALLVLALQSMTGAFWRSAFAAALFAWHPLRVESVAWISERKDVLSGFFFLLTLWAYGQYARHRQVPVSSSSASSAPGELLNAKFYKLSLTFFVLGLLSKPMLVTVPFVLLLVDFWPLNRWPSSSDPRSNRPGIPKLLWLEKIPFLLLAAVVGVITYFAQKSGHAIENVSVPLRFETALVGYVDYLQKLFWPDKLACLYLRPQSVPPVQLVLALLILAGISILAALNWRRRPYLLAGWLWYCGILLPVSGIIPVGLQSMADRYTYLPMIGVSVMIVWGVCETVSQQLSPQLAKVIFPAIAIPLLIACAMVTHRQLFYWRNTEALMNHVLELDPRNFVAHANLGVYFSHQGKTQEALFHYQRARELMPAGMRIPFGIRGGPGSAPSTAPSGSAAP